MLPATIVVKRRNMRNISALVKETLMVLTLASAMLEDSCKHNGLPEKEILAFAPIVVEGGNSTFFYCQ